MTTQTYTTATLRISTLAFNEIKEKLLAAKYDHALKHDNTLIDMNGIALEEDCYKNPAFPENAPLEFSS